MNSSNQYQFEAVLPVKSVYFFNPKHVEQDVLFIVGTDSATIVLFTLNIACLTF